MNPSRHAECAECGRLLHLLGVYVNGRVIHVDDELWQARLEGTCPDCGGRLRDLGAYSCDSCDSFARVH